MKKEHAISPTRSEDYPEWYQQVVKAADLAENSPVRGCMVIKPWGYGIWENLQRQMDERFKATGHENAYFPLFIPLSFLQKEATHVEGFATECAVVTHHRLEAKDGTLVPASPLEEPLIVRPTSETIIGASFSKWIQSYRDLPVLVNQWANVVRWEMRPRVFLRTTEFLWQEGHTAHSTPEEANEEVDRMLEVYREFSENVLALPVIPGEKTPEERFPGAERTICIEAMMQDRKALQAGTSHFLGQNFAKASDIRFQNEDGELEYVYTTSWGTSTRLVGGVIMTHSDDDGLRLPPKLAPKQVVILPVVTGPDVESTVNEFAAKVKNILSDVRYNDRPLEVELDNRDLRGGEKNWQWIKKGIPIRIEAGPRDAKDGAVMLARRDAAHKDKEKIPINELSARIPGILEEIQNNMFSEAKKYRDENLVTDISDFEEFKKFFTPKNPDKPEIHGGFVKGKWCEDSEVEKQLSDLKVSIRCIPLEQSGTSGKCIISGRDATVDAIFAKAY